MPICKEGEEVLFEIFSATSSSGRFKESITGKTPNTGFPVSCSSHIILFLNARREPVNRLMIKPIIIS